LFASPGRLLRQGGSLGMRHRCIAHGLGNSLLKRSFSITLRNQVVDQRADFVDCACFTLLMSPAKCVVYRSTRSQAGRWGDIQ